VIERPALKTTRPKNTAEAESSSRTPKRVQMPLNNPNGYTAAWGWFRPHSRTPGMDWDLGSTIG